MALSGDGTTGLLPSTLPQEERGQYQPPSGVQASFSMLQSFLPLPSLSHMSYISLIATTVLAKSFANAAQNAFFVMGYLPQDPGCRQGILGCFFLASFLCTLVIRWRSEWNRWDREEERSTQEKKKYFYSKCSDRILYMVSSFGIVNDFLCSSAGGLGIVNNLSGEFPSTLWEVLVFLIAGASSIQMLFYKILSVPEGMHRFFKQCKLGSLNISLLLKISVIIFNVLAYFLINFSSSQYGLIDDFKYISKKNSTPDDIYNISTYMGLGISLISGTLITLANSSSIFLYSLSGAFNRTYVCVCKKEYSSTLKQYGIKCHYFKNECGNLLFFSNSSQMATNSKIVAKLEESCVKKFADDASNNQAYYTLTPDEIKKIQAQSKCQCMLAMLVKCCIVFNTIFSATSCTAGINERLTSLSFFSNQSLRFSCALILSLLIIYPSIFYALERVSNDQGGATKMSWKKIEEKMGKLPRIKGVETVSPHNLLLDQNLPEPELEVVQEATPVIEAPTPAPASP